MSQTKNIKYCLNCFTVFDASLNTCTSCGFVEPANNPQYLKTPFRLKQQYVIGRVLGHGGFAVTYLGFDQELKTKVAIKEYFPSEYATRNADQVTVSPSEGQKAEVFQIGKEKFLAEARLLSSLRNSNIIRIRHFFEAGNTAYFIMEYLEGTTLDGYLKEQGGKISFEKAKKLMFPLMNALEEVHDKGNFHRDIKPENIYITKKGTPILIDFGAARTQSGEAKQQLAFLTPGFAPLEQYNNGIQGPWTDIYALGATFYNAITGLIPPTPEVRVNEGKEPFLPTELGVSITKADEKWLMKALELKWSKRPESIEQWRSMMLTEEDLEREKIEAEKKRLEIEKRRLKAEMEEQEAAIRQMQEATVMELEHETSEELEIQQLANIMSQEKGIPFKEAIQKVRKQKAKAKKKQSGEEPEQAEAEADAPALDAQPKVIESKVGLPVIPTRFTNSLGIDFALVMPFDINEEGKKVYRQVFMGTPQDEYLAIITKPYYVQTTPMPQNKWQMVMGSNPSNHQGDEWLPVEMVSWNEVQTFIERLNTLNEGNYRLPTEAEWELACRCGIRNRYFWGDTDDYIMEYGWYIYNSREKSHPVGLKKANPHGLYDMYGNVWEWVEDRFADYPTGIIRDPQGPEEGVSRVYRGGCFSMDAQALRGRQFGKPNKGSPIVGFRLVLDVEEFNT